jgi:hypothetical protein
VCTRYPAVLLTAAIAWAQEPAILQLKVVEGEGAVYGIGARATRGVTVQVTDETGKPVEGAAVSFRLPDDGPTGTFNNGSRTDIATTGADGRASIWGMQWNRTAGALDLRITAVKKQARAGIVCSIYLSDSKDIRASASHGGRHGGHKFLWIGLAVAGAAAAGVATAGLAAKPGASAATAAQSLQIGAPTITVSHP